MSGVLRSIPMFRLPPSRLFLCLFPAVLAGGWPLFGQPVVRAASSLPARPQAARVDKDFGRIPLSFEPSSDNSSFIAHGSGYSVRLNPDGALLSLGQDDVVIMKLQGSDPAKPTARDLLPGTVNYFLGNDAKHWRTSIPTYAKVAYSGVYPGIDLVYYGDHRALEYDLVVAPKASVKSIRIRFAGARINLAANGDLQIKAQHGSIAFHQPIAYQSINVHKQPVQARFVKINDTEVAFAVGHYDRRQPLVIDPQIIYSTYFNGATVQAIAVDSAGSAYITGAAATTLPVTAGAFQTTDPEYSPNSKNAPQSAAFVSKLSPDGGSLVYSTYVGGTHQETGTAIAVDSSGNAYLTGTTRSPDFPVTSGAFQPTNRNPNENTTGFLVKLNPSGSGLVYSTYLGGSGHSGSQAER